MRKGAFPTLSYICTINTKISWEFDESTSDMCIDDMEQLVYILNFWKEIFYNEPCTVGTCR